MNTDELMDFQKEMSDDLTESSGTVYQYRPCIRNEFTIYDIENIRHGVVYARSPLNFNDPFDSRVGVSDKAIFDELVSMLLDVMQITGITNSVIKYILKYKNHDEMENLLSNLKQLKMFYVNEQKVMHQRQLSFEQFVNIYSEKLYLQMPEGLKKQLQDKNGYDICCFILGFLNGSDITEENIFNVEGLKDTLGYLLNQIEKIRDEKLIPRVEEFLETIAVSCFCDSGWDNPLMWAHYANSYKGFCVEYDFTDLLSKPVGVVKKVRYSKTRPTLSLKNLGFVLKIKPDGSDLYFEKQDGDKGKVIEALTTKDECWSYEKEWRIIGDGKSKDEGVPIPVRKIKSVTLGKNMDPLCRRLLIDVCHESNISCYKLVFGKDDYSIKREPITPEDYVFDFYEEWDYMAFLDSLMFDHACKMKEINQKLKETIEEDFDFAMLIETNRRVIDNAVDVYFLQNVILRIRKRMAEGSSVEDFDNLLTRLENVKASFGAEYVYLRRLRDVLNSEKDTMILQNEATQIQFDEFDEQLAHISSLIGYVENRNE